MPVYNIPFLLRDVRSGLRSLLGIVGRKQVFGGPRLVTLLLSKRMQQPMPDVLVSFPLLDAAEGMTGSERCSPGTCGPGFMDLQLCETIIRQAHEMGTFRFILGGHGEPLLHPHFTDILDLLLDLGKAPYIITNGLCLDDCYARALADKPVQIRISMHAGDIETWLRVHPASSASQFAVIARAIKTLTLSKRARVSLLHVIQRTNCRHVTKMIEHARDLGVKEVQFFPVRAQGPLTRVLPDSGEERELRNNLQTCLKLAAACNIKTNIEDYLSTNRYIQTGVPDTTNLYRRIPCYIGWTYTEFDTDGTMRPCENSHLVMGKAGETPLKELWYSDRYRVFRSEALNSRPVDGCLCSECSMNKFNINIYNLFHLRSVDYSSA